MAMAMAMDDTFASIRNAVQDLFHLYLGTTDASATRLEGAAIVAGVQSPFSKLRKKVSALPPPNEQFCADFEQLQSQFMDPNPVQSATETVLAALLVQCSGHAGQADFLLFALEALKGLAVVRWDLFVPLLLQNCAVAEGAGSQTRHGSVAPSPTSTITSPGVLMATSNPASGENHPSPNPNPSGGNSTAVAVTSEKKLVTWLRPLVCRVLLIALESDLSALTYFEILSHVVGWLNDLAIKEHDVSEPVGLHQLNQRKGDVTAWLYRCLHVIRVVIDENKCRVPFYALLHDHTQLSADYWAEDSALLGLFLEVHRRRDKIALHMLMLDHHLHSPTFATLRMSAFTYPSRTGEPVYGEDVVAGVQRDSLDWERALRCLRHGLRTNPSADVWRRILLHAPRYLKQVQQQQPFPPRAGPISWTQPGPVFSADMTCEAVVDRIMELMQPFSSVNGSNTGSGSVSMTESGRWQEWLIFADLFYFLMRSGYLDFLEFIDRLATRFTSNEHSVLRTNHVTWLLAQVFRLETVTQSLGADSKKVETAQKILSFHMTERPADQSSNITPLNMLLDFVGSSQILRLWAFNRPMMEHLAGNRMPEHIQKGKTIDEWCKQVVKGERSLDYSNLDDKSMGMVWVLSHTMTAPVCDAIMAWMNSNGVTEGNFTGQMSERIAIIQETRPLPITLLSGLSLYLSIRLLGNIEEQIFSGHLVLSIAMLETYVRLLLVAPQTLFRHHVNGMMQKYQSGIGKAGVSLLLFELLNYRLIPLYRFHGKVKQLIFDIAKIIISFKSKRGDHRLFRLAENLCINLILSLREVTLIKKELKGAATDFTETLNRMMVVNLAMTLKTRGIAEFEQIIILQPALDQILASSQHTWSEKTIRHFPPLLRDALLNRPDRRMHGTIQTWQQIESAVIHQCRQLLSPGTDASYVITFLNHGFPQHRQYLCAAAWVLMDGRPESINLSNLGRTLKEFSPDEVTLNIYTMVDVLLHHTQLQLQHGHSLQDLLLRASACLAQFMWVQELLPFDIVLLALTDRDDDTHALRLVVGLLLDRPEFQQRVQHYCAIRGQQDHWMNPGPFNRPEPQQALGNHLAGKDRYPLFFDDMCMRALPVLPLVIHRLIENDATETAERVLVQYLPLLVYHPSRFSFVRDTLAYFYGHLPNKLVIRLLSALDLSKIPISESFLQHLRPAINSGGCPPVDYFANLLIGLVNNVIPPIASKSRQSFTSMDNSQATARFGPSKLQTAAGSFSEVQKPFYQYQDPGSHSQLLLETAVVELLSLPPPVDRIVSMLVQIAVRIPMPLFQIQSSSSHNLTNLNPKSPLLPTSPPAVADPNSATATAPISGGAASSSGIPQSMAPLVIQACALLLTQLPAAFHKAFYEETSKIMKGCWWISDSSKHSLDVESAFGYTVWDPTWAVQDGTSTVVGNTIALLHAFGANLPFEWLEGMHAIISLQRPMQSVAHLRLAFRIMGPLLPRLAISRPLFAKTLLLLFTIMAEVFGPSSQMCSNDDMSEISDLIDFLHHAVMLEVQGSGQSNGKPKMETLTLCSKAVERLHPSLQKRFVHLTPSSHVSIYAATHPKISHRPSSSPQILSM